MQGERANAQAPSLIRFTLPRTDTAHLGHHTQGRRTPQEEAWSRPKTEDSHPV